MCVTKFEESGCECGATTPCIDTWHEGLALEQADPQMYAWHTPLVCAYILQHSSRMLPQFADGQFRMLQFYIDQGIEATNALARHQVARNNASGSGFDMKPLEPYAALPAAGRPPAFSLSIHSLRDADGGFLADGHRAYGERMHRLSRSTVDAWLLLRG